MSENPGPLNGPTLSGCEYDSKTNYLKIFYDRSLLEGDSIFIDYYNSVLKASGFEIQSKNIFSHFFALLIK